MIVEVSNTPSAKQSLRRLRANACHVPTADSLAHVMHTLADVITLCKLSGTGVPFATSFHGQRIQAHSVSLQRLHNRLNPRGPVRKRSVRYLRDFHGLGVQVELEFLDFMRLTSTSADLIYLTPLGLDLLQSAASRAQSVSVLENLIPSTVSRNMGPLWRRIQSHNLCDAAIQVYPEFYGNPAR